MKKDKVLWNLLIGTGVYLLDTLRERAGDSFEDLSGRARDTYDEASRRAIRASAAGGAGLGTRVRRPARAS